ncbi:butyrophilin-like protein 2 [Garra rufa]|uniref:butyrophilin-like protein 2 n=1 Tax=Garra rufa TaxID=137080 RepID=UPI003CCE7472
MAARSGNDFQLIIPERGERVKINSGSILTVSCHLSPALSAADMEITWFGEMSCICAYKDREMTHGVGYEGRASLFIHDLKRGNVSLRVADFRESDLGVYMCRVINKNETQQITVNVAEEVSAIFKDHFFTVNYKMGETSNKLSEHHGDSDNQLEDCKTGEATYQLSIHSGYHSASGKDHHKDCEGQTDNKLSSQYIKSDPSHPDKHSGDNRMRAESKAVLSQASYHNEPNKSQHGDSKKEVLSNNNFELVVPSAQEPEVSLGSDLIIPCHLSPAISAVEMEISWSNDTACVCLYKDRLLTEGVLFKDRVSLFTHKLREGNVSLQVKNFKLSDIGNYHCQVSSKDRREKITVRVRMNHSPIFPEGNKDKRTREPTILSMRTSHHSDSDEKQCGNCRRSVSDNFQLVIPQTTQEAKISMGSKVIVPCHLSPEMCAIAMQIKWFKETDCVCIYKNGHVIEGRSYKDKASLTTHVLERGDVSLHLNNFSVSDVGDYCCQVISRDTTNQITVGVRIKPEVQPVSQSPTFQGQSVQLMLSEIDKIWTEEETNKMDESALMSEMKVNNLHELQQMLFRAYREGCLNWS